jgi:phosphoglycolate phosphatase
MKHIPPHIKVVLFDHDDTLVGTIEAKWAAHKHIAKTHYGKQLTDDDIRKHWGKPLRTLVGLLYDDDDIDRAMQRERDTHKDFPKQIFEDTEHVLQKLKDSGKKIGIITATSRWSFEYDLGTMNIDESLIDYSQTEDDTDYHKPDPRVFEPAITWLKSQNIKPEEVVYVGDGLHDMKAALGAGFEFIGVATGLVTQKQFSDSGSRSVKKLSDLVQL